MSRKSLLNNRVIILHLFLLLYVIAQFVWWAYHIIKLNRDLAILGAQFDLNAKIYMVVGEGVVFLLILIIGTYLVFKAFKREIELSNLQNNFLLAVTHEFKSPLASIQMNLETINETELTRENQLKIVTNSLQQTYRLSALVNNILVSAKIESQQVREVKSPQNISNLFETILSDLVVDSTTSNRIQFNGSNDNQQTFPLDPELFKLTFINLIDNALKYSKTDVVISWNFNSDSLSIRVSDYGSGIESSEQDSIFSKFYRVGNEMTRNTQGSGLGLFIVRQLCAIQNAVVTVKENQPKGSIFEVTFERDF